MKNRTIEILALIFGALTAVAGILTLPQVAMLPKEYQSYIGVALALVVVGKNGAYVLLDFLDDGILNKSYTRGVQILVLLLCCLCLCQCVNDRFLGLNKDQWKAFGGRVGNAAKDSALDLGKVAVTEYFSEKNAVDVTPSGK